MNYVYAALILHEADRELTEDNLTTVLGAAGVDVAESRVKALVAALEDVDIEAAIEQPAVPAGAPAPAAGEEAPPEGEEAKEAADEEEAEKSRRRGTCCRGTRRPVWLTCWTVLLKIYHRVRPTSQLLD